MFLRVVASSLIALLISYTPIAQSRCGPVSHVYGPVTYYYTAKGRIYAVKIGNEKYYCSARDHTYKHYSQQKHYYKHYPKNRQYTKRSHPRGSYSYTYLVPYDTVYVYRTYSYPYRVYQYKTYYRTYPYHWHYVYRTPVDYEYRYYRDDQPFYYEAVFFRR